MSRIQFTLLLLAVLSMSGLSIQSAEAALNQSGCGNRSQGGSTGGSSDSGGSTGGGGTSTGCTQTCSMTGIVNRDGVMGVTCRTTCTGGGGTSTGGGGTTTTPPPRACTMTVSPSSIAEGGGPVTVGLSPTGVSRTVRLWSLFPYVSRTLATFSTGMSSQRVDVADLAEGRYSLSTSFTQSGSRYACSATLTVTEPPLPMNLTTTIGANGGSGISGTARIQNSGPNPISTPSDRIIRYRKVGENRFTTVYSGLGTYTRNQTWTRNFTISPATDGDYEVCAYADRSDAVIETDERDNRACAIVTVDRTTPPGDDDDGTDDPDGPGGPGGPGGGGGTTNPPTISIDPGKVRKGTTATIDYNTGGNTNCVITGNGQTVPVSTNPRNGTIDTTPIQGETTYTLTCDGVAPATATVEVLPSLEEF